MALNEASLEAVRSAMRAKAPRVPAHYDRVHKEECAFSFDTAFSPAGIYINLANWQAYGHDYVQLDHQRSGNCLYLHETWKKVSKPANPFSAVERINNLVTRHDMTCRALLFLHAELLCLCRCRCHRRSSWRNKLGQTS